jgi:hypothetical protein
MVMIWLGTVKGFKKAKKQQITLKLYLFKSDDFTNIVANV